MVIKENYKLFKNIKIKFIFLIFVFIFIISECFSKNTFGICNDYEGSKKCLTEIDNCRNCSKESKISNREMDYGLSNGEGFSTLSVNNCIQEPNNETCTSFNSKYDINSGNLNTCPKNCLTCDYDKICKECNPGSTLKNGKCLESITLHFVGDIVMDRRLKKAVYKHFGGDYSYIFNNFDYMKKSDIAFANLEAPVSLIGKEIKSIFAFRMEPVVLPLIREAGIDIVTLANNHIGNWGPDAFTDTLKRLTENEILYTGGGFSKKEAEEPIIFNKKGIKIGFLGFSQRGLAYTEATSDKPGILLTTDPNLEKIIKNAANKVNYLIVTFHWGKEYEDECNSDQRKLARLAIDNGAKLIIGHHPHVIQNTEVYKNVFIAYSLGNFIMDQEWSEKTMTGMLLEVILLEDGSTHIKNHITQQNQFYQLQKLIVSEKEQILKSKYLAKLFSSQINMEK